MIVAIKKMKAAKKNSMPGIVLWIYRGINIKLCHYINFSVLLIKL